jgi:molybdate transport system ATP-binding protein
MSRHLIIDGCLSRPGFMLEVQLDVDLDHTVGLQGATGAGKTSLLRIVAGLEPDFTGYLQFGANVWHDSAKGISVPTHLRKLGVVFQDARLLPGRTVLDNFRFAESRSSAPLHPDQLARLAGDFSVDTLMDRSVDALSGGERQRVSLVQALLTQPQLLLLDEPFSANDDDHRRHVATALSDWLYKEALPLICVSHSAQELHLLTRTTLKMEAGRIVQQGATADILTRDSGDKVFGAKVLEVDQLNGRVTFQWDPADAEITDLTAGDRIYVSHQPKQGSNLGAPLQPQTEQNHYEAE